MVDPDWKVGFEVELIFGDLGVPSFIDYMDVMGPMDRATPGFCQEVARRLTRLTGQRWSAPRHTPRKTGFYVLSEYDLDPLDWPRDRCAGVELLTPPLPLLAADDLRSRIADAVFEIDGDFNFDANFATAQCAWHINVDAGQLKLDPADFILCTDELSLLLDNARLFTPYTGMQRHAVGPPLLRLLEREDGQALLGAAGLDNLLRRWAGRTKRYAANFGKLERGYVELRHFASTSFLDHGGLQDHLAPILPAFDLWFSQSGPFVDAFTAKFELLHQWLRQNRERISWTVKPGVVAATGEISFDGERAGYLIFNGSADVALYDAAGGELAIITGLELWDIAEGVALLALDLAELSHLGAPSNSVSTTFNEAIADLANRLAADSRLSAEYLTKMVASAAAERDERRSAYAQSIVDRRR